MSLDDFVLTEATQGFDESAFPDSMAEYHVSQEERDNAVYHAEKAGCTVYKGSPAHLLLDFDKPYKEGKKYGVAEAWDIFSRYHPDFHREFWKSRGGNTHCLVTLKEPIPSAAARVAWQAALGSDPKREALSLVRIANGIEEPSLLFRPAPV